MPGYSPLGAGRGGPILPGQPQERREKGACGGHKGEEQAACANGCPAQMAAGPRSETGPPEQRLPGSGSETDHPERSYRAQGPNPAIRSNGRRVDCPG